MALPNYYYYDAETYCTGGEAIIRVLFVDDEENILDIAKRFLEKEQDLQVETALSAEEAFRVLGRTTYDAIVSDHEMPGLDGLMFLKLLRGQGDRTPFIIFSGRSRQEAIVDALNSGADFFIQKGVDVVPQYSEMVHKIRQVVRERRTAAAFAESEARYRAVVEDQTEFICRFTPNGTLTFANTAFLRCYGLPSEAIGTRFRPQIPRSELERVRDHFTSLAVGHPTGVIEHRAILPDGTIRWQQWSDRAIFSPDGSIIEYQSVGRDITDRKTAEEALQKYSTHLEELVEERTKKLNEANRFAAIGETTHLIGHDLRNPLQVIENEVFLGKMRIEQMSPEEHSVAAKYRLDVTLDRVEDQAGYMNKIILDLQDYARPVEIVLSAFPVAGLFDEIISAAAIPPDVRIRNDIGPDLFITADQNFMKRALSNILMNALQAIHGTGEISIFARGEDDRVVIGIRDTGAGMDEAELAKAFSPLYTTKPKGTGLGLNVSRRLIEEQGGGLTLQSRKGEGTTALITLPRRTSGTPAGVRP